MFSCFLTTEAALDRAVTRPVHWGPVSMIPHSEGACLLTAVPHTSTVNLLLLLRGDSNLNKAIRMKKRPSCLGPEENKQTGSVCTPPPRGAILHPVISSSYHSLFPSLGGRGTGLLFPDLTLPRGVYRLCFLHSLLCHAHAHTHTHTTPSPHCPHQRLL